jgi:Hemerythrin HHE cation binding domain
MSMDFLTLLRRDHHDLACGLEELSHPWTTVAELRGTLDGVRLGLTAHAEAEDIVLFHVIKRCTAGSIVEGLVMEARDAHLAQEGALAALVCSPPSTSGFRDRAGYLRSLVQQHARYEESKVLPALRRLAPPEVYDSLAGAFATERLRQLAMLQPSAPIYIAELAAAG